MELNREIHRCHRCTFSICRLLPPSPRCFSFYLSVFAYSLHPFCGWIRRGLSPFGLLLTWVSAGGASRWRILLRRQPIWACGGKTRVEYEQNDRNTETASFFRNSQGTELEAMSDISKQRVSQRERNRDRRALIKASLPSIPITGGHILIGPTCAVHEHFSICLNGKLKRGRLLFWPE